MIKVPIKTKNNIEIIYDLKLEEISRQHDCKYKIFNNYPTLNKIYVKCHTSSAIGNWVEITSNEMTYNQIKDANMKPLLANNPINFKLIFKLIFFDKTEKIVSISREKKSGNWIKWFENNDNKLNIFIGIYPANDINEYATIKFNPSRKKMVS